MYEVSASGVVRNRFSRRPVKSELPRASDPHRYVRLILKDSVAHCWLPESAGFRLSADGNPTSDPRVFYLDKDATNCSAANLTVMGELEAFQRGLAVTSRFRSRRSSQQVQPQWGTLCACWTCHV